MARWEIIINGDNGIMVSVVIDADNPRDVGIKMLREARILEKTGLSYSFSMPPAPPDPKPLIDWFQEFKL